MTAKLEYNELLQRYEQSELWNIVLELQLAQLQKVIFVSRHERFVPGSHPSQPTLDISAEPVTACGMTYTQNISYTRTKKVVEEKSLSHPGRRNYLFAGSHCLSRTAGKPPKAVACTTPCSAPARCMALSLLFGSKICCIASLTIRLTSLLNFCRIPTKNNRNFIGVVGQGIRNNEGEGF